MLDQIALFPEYSNKKIKNTFFCKYLTHALPIRDPNSKWYASNDEYNQKLYGMNQYPAYCAGMGLLMTSDLVSRLYEATYDLKGILIEFFA